MCGPGSGIFMSIVYILGPKNNFGGSEQNPAFWIQLLLAANGENQSLVTCKWFDPKMDEEVSCKLIYGDWRIWVRFTLSFLVNGVGFHILVHALPIQVAYQSSLSKFISLHMIQLSFLCTFVSLAYLNNVNCSLLQLVWSLGLWA
jgi:hypothetical protein